LEETPSDEDFIYPDVLPGESHDGDAQCRYQYGSQSMQCRKEVQHGGGACYSRLRYVDTVTGSLPVERVTVSLPDQW